MPMYPSPKASGEKRHMVATKSFLESAIRRYGAKEVLTDFQGTDDEAIRAVLDDPREVFAFSCDNYDEKGYCLGHPIK